MLKFKRMGRLAACLLLLCMVLSLLPAPVTAEPAASAEASGQTVSLVRRSAYSGSTVIGCLQDGAALKVLGTKNGFFRIDCYDMTGYIAVSQVQRNVFGEYYVSCKEGSSETKRLNAYSETDAAALRSQIHAEALKHRGVPYVYGGSTPRGFDCSGYTQYVLRKAGLYVNRTCLTQLQNGIIIPKDELQCGDLVFFQNTGDGGFASHVGIYLGDGKLIHAGSKGITVVNLSDRYFTYHYMCARRMVISQTAEPEVGQTRIPAVGINQNINGSYWRESSRTEESGNSFL